MNRYLPPLFALCLVACTNYNHQTCNDLAMKKYQGRPKESHEYDNNCKDKVAHPISPTVCQKALELLIVEGRKERLQKTFGDEIINCFTKDDLKRFLRE